MLYSARNLKKTYNGRTVLDIPELSIEKEKIYALLGPNGSGKTTLLHILSFILPPSTGTIFYNDKPVQFLEKALQQLRKEVVLVDQHPILFSTSVHKNVEFGLKMRDIAKKDRRRITEESLDLVGMRDFEWAAAAHLSGGETQRVAIARALACRPKVILFDEPTASVDVENQIAIENIIQSIHRERKISVIVCTHNMLQASKLAEETLFLFEGRPTSSIYENIFGGKVIMKGGRSYCAIDDKVLIPVKTDQTGFIKISIHPKSIKFASSPKNDASSVFYDGRISQLSEEKGWIRILVNIGIPLSVFMKKKEFDLFGTGIGQNVTVKCSDYGVEIIGSETMPG
ncbi:MAG TPA: ATP-binding cassette domain-containing protein [Desulfobacterales bacterium]|nr:ATP-binding cassette domain-containing protein [Desulfobacterales bacterium]